MKRVLVTGMGIISPIGNTISAFWESLMAGQCGIGPITRFSTEGYKVKIAAEVKAFDPSLYGIDTSATHRMDLFTQYAMAAAKQAMDDSGLATHIFPHRFGVYVGSGIGGMQTFTKETEKLLNRGPDRVSPLFIPMMIGNIASGNIAIQYQAKGPSLPVVTACATSTHAIGEAYRAIKHGYADAILAGGAEAAVVPLAIAGFTNCKALTEESDPMRASLPFDIRRKGFVLGEGAAIIVLEEYQHAMKRGAPVYGELVGYGNTCDAYHITAPHPEAEGAASAITLALKEAKAAPGERIYINAHGTGTPLNDQAETLAIKRALGEEAVYHALVSSTKSATGHMLGAAGGAECIATLLALKEGRVPPTLHLDEPDPACDLDYVPHVPRKADITLGLSISLGFGGHNGVLAMRGIS